MKSPIWTIFRKEVLENLRDRKTVMNALIVSPLIGPLIFALLISTVMTRELGRAEKVLELPVIGAEQAPNLVAFIGARNIKIKPGPTDPIAAINAQDEEVILRIGKDYAEDWNKGEPAEVELIYDGSRQDTDQSRRRVEDALSAYGQQVGALRLVARGVSPLIVRPLAIVDRDQASDVARGAQFLAFLPYMLILGAFMGGMYLAIDTTAGERERQSLEPLLATPVPRGQIMLGKLSATSAFAIASLFLTLIAFALLLPQLPLTKLGLKFNLGVGVFLQLLLTLAPVVLLASSLQTLIAANAKSYREAQSWLGLFTIIPAIPSMIMMVVPVKAQLWMFAVPLLAQHQAIMRLVRAESISVLEWSVLAGTGLAIAGIAAAIAARIYHRESLAVSA
ncbi:MAG TPA: ABC transporter permease [Pseudomonadota bacterium]|nr:ABC transporter permease [Pseudomonadota bacterium]